MSQPATESTRILHRQLLFYVMNQAEYVKKYDGKILLFHDEKLVNSYDTRGDAFRYGIEHFKPGTFLIIKCSDGDAEYSFKDTLRLGLMNCQTLA